MPPTTRLQARLLAASQATTTPPHATTPNTTAVSFDIMELPDELVVRIIQHAVVLSTSTNPIPISYDNGDNMRPPNITRVNKWFRAEGVKVFYTKKFFLGQATHGCADAFWAWLGSLSPNHAAMIEHMHFEWVDMEGEIYAHIRQADGKLVQTDDVVVTFFDFLLELVFLGEHVGERTPRHNLFFRVHGGKVVLDISQPNGIVRYQLGIQRAQHDSAFWKSAKKFLETHAESFGEEELKEEWGEAVNETDFWVGADHI